MMGKGVLVANVREYLQHKAFWNLFTCAEVPSSGGWRRYQVGGGAWPARRGQGLLQHGARHSDLNLPVTPPPQKAV